MKKLITLKRIILLLSQLFTHNLFAQQPVPVSVPVKAKQLLKQMHPQVENVRWSSGYYLILAEFNEIDPNAKSYLPVDGDCTVEFYTANQLGKKAGTWWRTMKHYYTPEGIAAKVPAAVLTNIKKQLKKMEGVPCTLIGVTELTSDNDCFELANSGKATCTKGYFVAYKRDDSGQERYDLSFTAQGTLLYELP